jgi:thiol:disulfide interchange protein DsbA
MKKHLVFIGLLLLFSCSKGEQEAQQDTKVTYKENTHYIVLDHPSSNMPQVQEFFSFWCPHCYHFEPIVSKLKPQLGAEVVFQKVHVDFMGFASQEIQQQASEAMLVARQLGKEAQINKAIFEHIHVNNKPLTNMDELLPILASQQITPSQFQNSLESEQGKMLLDAHNQSFSQYRDDITGVPTVIVNGKYKVTFTNEMTVEDMISLIIWLTQQP